MQNNDIMRDFREMDTAAQTDFAAAVFDLMTEEERAQIIAMMEQLLREGASR